MFLSYIPYLTYAAPAIAGIFIMVIAVELPKKWAYASYAVSSVLIFLMAESEAKILYILFFGIYPIVKGTIEQCNNRVAEYIIKFFVFNLAMAADIIASIYLLGIPVDNGNIPLFWFYAAFAAIANVFFAVYDVALSRLVSLYVFRLHPRVKKLL